MRGEPARKLPPCWNLSKAGGWKKYKEKAENVANLIEECSSEETMAKVKQVFKKEKKKKAKARLLEKTNLLQPERLK